MKRLSNFLIVFGIAAVAFSLIVFIFTFFPIIKNELDYSLIHHDANANIVHSVDDEFGIVIPKIGANSKVIADVNPYNESEYQWALTKGVAHAKGSVYPGEKGNVFLFSHSSVDFYEALRYNSIFYLLNKLKKDDKIYLFYKKVKYQYKIVEIKYADPTNISYLRQKMNRKTVTLMTCWPPGTTFKRLLVIGELVKK
ncbi:MAG TPA: sortase [Candidatus Saccharimonadales bacterium]|nr:sortase [Candidatus Saccharimonadales bacterium]